MNAIVFSQTGGPEVLRLSEVPKPEVRPGMVLIRVHAVGVNFADTRFRQGTYVVKPKRPDTPGLEAAGSSPLANAILVPPGDRPEWLDEAAARAALFLGSAWNVCLTGAVLDLTAGPGPMSG